MPSDRTSALVLGSERPIAAILSSRTDARGQVCDLAAIFATYDAAGKIETVLDSSFSRPPFDLLPDADVVRADGIWRYMLEAVLEAVDLVVAHDAWAQRRAIEAVHGGFTDRDWACSRSEIPWTDLGFGNDRLVGIGAHLGLVLRGCRAHDECRLLFDILAHGLWSNRRAPLAHLLAAVASERVRLFACDPPVERQGVLQHRGYRCSSGTDGSPDAPFIDLDRSDVEAERSFLAREIYRSEPDLIEQRLPADRRYRLP